MSHRYIRPTIHSLPPLQLPDPQGYDPYSVNSTNIHLPVKVQRLGLFLTLSFSSNPRHNQLSSSVSLSRGLVHKTHSLIFIQKYLLSSDYRQDRHHVCLCLYCLLLSTDQSSPDVTEEIASQ